MNTTVLADIDIDDRLTDIIHTIYDNFKALEEKVTQLDSVVASSVPRARYEVVLESWDKNKRLLNTVKTSLETVVCSLQTDSNVNYHTRQRFKTILNHIVDMIKNN